MNSEEKYAESLREMLWKNNRMMQILKTLKGFAPEAFIATGMIRNTVWANLHDQSYDLDGREVDVIFYDPFNKVSADDLQQKMAIVFPNMQWDVTNQAFVHTWYRTDCGEKIAPISSVTHALSLWPETATSVALRLNAQHEIEYVAPFGLADLFELKLCWNKNLVSHSVFLQRLKSKRFLEKWPKRIRID